MRARCLVALLFATLAGASWATAADAAGSKKTHLGVSPRQVVNVSTFQVPNDNSGEALFYYDRNFDQPFSVPEGFSFVVTDVFVLVDVTPGGAGEMQVLVNENSSRSLTLRYAPAEDRHFALAGGLVISGGTIPAARNTTSSSLPCNIQMLGYFVKAPALGEGESPFPAPAP